MGKVKECKHEWYVLATTQQDKSLMVRCHRCKRYGFVEDPDKDEWNDAAEAGSEPYLWEDNSRVVVWPGGL